MPPVYLLIWKRRPRFAGQRGGAYSSARCGNIPHCCLSHRGRGLEHLAIVIGDPDPETLVLVRLHSECFTGDLLGSLRCDCGDQLRGAIDVIAREGAGLLLYLAQEGRGIGLVNKLRAYNLQDQGFDTMDANGQLGFYDDERLFLLAAGDVASTGVFAGLSFDQ